MYTRDIVQKKHDDSNAKYYIAEACGDELNVNGHDETNCLGKRVNSDPSNGDSGAKQRLRAAERGGGATDTDHSIKESLSITTAHPIAYE